MAFNSIVNWFGDRFLKSAKEKLDARMRSAGEAAVREATMLVPVRTGYLQSSIGYVYDQSKQELRVHADAPYAFFVEYGTRFMLAHPFLRPALNTISREFGGNLSLEFPNTPNLVGTSRPGSARTASINKDLTRRLAKGGSRKASVSVSRGKWNGPNGGRTPWKGR